MADSTDELEPLFDYRRVQPRDFISIDDDSSDTSPLTSQKRRKHCPNPKSVGEDSDDDLEVIENVNCKDKDEEDWLPPPPKVSTNLPYRVIEDSTIKELRLKRQELQSLATSGVEVLRTVEESVRRELSTSVAVKGSSDIVSEQPIKSNAERAKIVISIQNKDEIKQFRVYKDDKFERLFKLYADKLQSNIQSFVFSFDGDKISPTATPDSLGMEDDDIIEVHLKKSTL